jgi:CDP-diacylglycerol---glycerol-3-phosphate 3-phosphatidyltransferase
MQFIKTFKKTHNDLFSYQKATVVHPHDRFLERTIIRFIPEWVTPNRLSVFRILATPFVFLLLATNIDKAGIAVFLLVAFTDALDGSIARTRNKITEFGKLADPLADKLLIGSMVFLLVFEYYGFAMGVTILVLEFYFIFFALVMKLRFKTVKGANLWGKIKMISQVIAVFVTLLALIFHSPLLFTLGAWMFGLAIGFAVLSLFRHGI